jgi:hypothetical protein
MAFLGLAGALVTPLMPKPRVSREVVSAEG